ncbi:MAG: heavy metal translocating P-type ATPase [Pseudomonadota bacterium]
MLYISKTVLQGAYRGLVKQNKANIDLLVLVSNGALLFSGHIFWANVSVVLYAVNHRLLHTVKSNAKSGLVDIFRQQSKSAWVLQDGVECEVPVTALTTDSVILVGAGEVIPVDGRIVQGIATIDQHVLTGEAQPVEKLEGDEVFASTLVLSGRIQVRANQIGEQTTAAQIGHILQRTADTKTPQQLQVETLSDKTVLPTLMAGMIAAPLFSSLGAIAIFQAHFKHRMSIVSVIGLLNYLNLASHRGLLIKDGGVLETLHQVNTVVFDKTGTLTEEVPEVADIFLYDKVHTENDILRYAAAAEGKQTHPIARAIVHAARQRHIAIPEVTQAEYQVGYGLSVMVEEQLVQLGSLRFIRMSGITFPDGLESKCIASAANGCSIVFVAVAGRLVANITLQPKVRPEARQVIDKLKRRGVKKTYIISGDQTIPTRQLAETLGIDDFFAEVLPEQKAQLIADLQQTGQSVCFVGDGINDCIAMQQADVSVSLGNAATAATDTAQVLLLDNHLAQLDDLFDLSDQCMSRVQTSYALVALPGVISITGSLFFHFGLTTIMLLPQAGLAAGLLYSMYPLLRYGTGIPVQNDYPHPLIESEDEYDKQL